VKFANKIKNSPNKLAFLEKKEVREIK
jgi:hypothetical protein